MLEPVFGLPRQFLPLVGLLYRLHQRHSHRIYFEEFLYLQPSNPDLARQDLRVLSLETSRVLTVEERGEVYHIL